jgi:hypothetical protein
MTGALPNAKFLKSVGKSPISKPITIESLETVTVQASRIVTGVDGAIALALVTDHLGTIAFEANLEAISLLQKQLAQAEQAIRIQGAPQE